MHVGIFLFQELPYNNIYNLYLPNYKLHFCKIPKNANTVISAIICYLADVGQFSNMFYYEKWIGGLTGQTACWEALHKSSQLFLELSNQTNLSDVTICSCTHLFDFTDFVFQIGNINHVTVVRDPVERFVSAWLLFCFER